MKRLPNTTLLALLLTALAAVAARGQSPQADATLKSATQTAKDIQSKTGAKPGKPRLPTGEPCTILPLAEVQKAFPGAKAGERSPRLEQYGTTECSWKGPNGSIVLVVQESFNSGASAKEDALGMAQGFTDPFKPQSQKNVRIEAFPGLKVDAAAFVETTDAKRGILGEGALMELRKGEHNVSIGSPELPRRDRAAALKTFEDLGRAASNRLLSPP